VGCIDTWLQRLWCLLDGSWLSLCRQRGVLVVPCRVSGVVVVKERSRHGDRKFGEYIREIIGAEDLNAEAKRNFIVLKLRGKSEYVDKICESGGRSPPV